MNVMSTLNPIPVRDSMGRSPWVGRARSFDEYKKISLPEFNNPYVEEPDGDLVLPGINGIDGFPTEYRLAKDLWLPGTGFLYREAFSCARMKLNARMRAAIQFITEHMNVSSNSRIYVTEMVTPMFDFIKDRYPSVTGSEFLPDVSLGSISNGIRCEDLQALTFDDDSFDLILSFDVLEHVPEYKKAIREMARTIRPGGHLIMTAPAYLDGQDSHRRAVIHEDGTLEHLLPPEYHGNPLGPPSLCFTSFGFNLVEDLRHYGFRDSYAQLYFNLEMGYWGKPQVIYIATK